MVTWACEAYGELERVTAGPMCFFSQVGRVCPTSEVCARRMTDERQRVWDLIVHLAAQGEEVWQQLLAELDGPDDLLNP